MLDICQKITASIPADAQTEGNRRLYPDGCLPELEKLFGVKGHPHRQRAVVFPRRMSRMSRRWYG